ncbi:hypothetical protein QTQ03_21125 [Micromonospora sp. WMMA1363]|uniref:ABC transporter permease n=1 Tax=Micromonospora sp. WMMA1363 TaxID=3053985 RepID=UPI00259D27CB|nr:FtsX-like permease family protein [Micromonospora sp. WMMA1363]MDM4721971.1 hypothetical protein [Micromonospora sp. WMMA1363]
MFVAQGPANEPSLDAFTPGTRLTLDTGGRTSAGTGWTLPAATRTVPASDDPSGWPVGAILATPGAIDLANLGSVGITMFAGFAPGDRDALEHLRNAATMLDPLSSVNALSATSEARRFVNVRRGLYIGAVVTLLLIGTSMLVGVLEQLRERRRLLAMLVAVGIRRSTLAGSVLWQTAVPVLIGLALAVVFGLGLGVVLLRMIGGPIAVNWPVVGVSTGLAAVVMMLLAGLSLPALWRLMRADGLRSE